ncbi:hypothetical protein P8605_49085, partial [Streptomyces sp. T-3]|nr:hypothetical protein [Streptomyces sp. T-3]
MAHVHPELSPYAPPEEGEFDRLNAVMLIRAGERSRVRELWRVGEPYEDRLVHSVRITRGRGPRHPRTPEVTAPVPPEVVPGSHGVTPLRTPDRRAAVWRARSLTAAVSAPA